MASTTVTAVKIDRQVVQGAPYLQSEDIGAENRMLATLLSPGRYVKPSEIIAAAWLVTVPAGTLFYVAIPGGLVRVELEGAVSVLGDATDNKIGLVVGQKSNGQLGAVLLAQATLPAGALALGVVATSVFTDDSGLSKKNLKVQIYTIPIPALDATGSQFIVIPSSGLITRVSIVANGQPSATVTATLEILDVAVTGGAVTLLSTDVLGTVKAVTPSAANVIKAGQALEVSFNHNGNTTAGTASVQVEVTE